MSKVKKDLSQTPFPRQSTTCWLLSPFVKSNQLLEQVPPESDGATSEVSLQYKSCPNPKVESEQERNPLQRRLSTVFIVEFEHTCTPSQQISDVVLDVVVLLLGSKGLSVVMVVVLGSAQQDPQSGSSLQQIGSR